MVKDDSKEKIDKGVNVTRLRETLREDYKRLKPWRTNRDTYIKEYVGPMHGPDASNEDNPVNNIQQYVNVISRMLTPGNPQCTIDSFNQEVLPDARSLEHTINRHIKKNKVGKIIEKAVIEAQYAMGIVKTGLRATGTAMINGEEETLTEPEAEVIEFNDFVWDIGAANFESVQYAGDRFVMSIDEIEDIGIFDKKAIKAIKKSVKVGNYRDDERPSHSLVSGENERESYRDSVYLWNVWLPYENRLVIFLDDDSNDYLLSNEEYVGPDHGPYNLLTINDVPGNVMPAAPISNLYKLHRLINKLFAKTARQALRQKTVGAVQSGGGKDAERLTAADDGQVVNVKNPKSLQELKFGGADQGVVAFSNIASDILNKQSGNLEVIGGLDQQADTLGQERLLSGSASAQLKKQAESVETLTKQVITDLAFYIYDDPYTQYPIKKEVQGVSDLTISSQFGPENRTEDFVTYDIDIQPYSLSDRTPEEQVNTLVQMMTGLFLPLQQQMAEQGLTINLSEMASFISDRSNMPVLSRVITYADGTPTTNENKGSGDRPLQAANTTRTNIRKNAPTSDKPGIAELTQQLGEGNQNGN